MVQNDSLGRVLRIIGIVLMGLTATFNLLGGIGTVCAAFLTEQFPPMLPLLPYRGLYQILMIATILVGLFGVWTVILLIQGRQNAYRNTVIILLVGVSLGAIHYFASLAIRGKAAPANMKFYLNALTLLYFLALRLPGIRDRVSFDRYDESLSTTAANLTMLTSGLLVSSAALWAAPSHTFANENWVHVLDGQLLLTGGVLLIMGLIGILWVRRRHREGGTSLQRSR